MAQVVPYSDEDLEQLYLFAKVLPARLPANRSVTANRVDVAVA